MRAVFLIHSLILLCVMPNAAMSISPPDTESAYISEISAAGSNGLVLLDEDGEMVDWIEVHNPTEAEIPLAGWALTDNLDTPDKWVFPEVDLPPEKFLVVFASGKDRRPTDGGNLHTNFRLTEEGEFLALVDSSFMVRTLIAPAYPSQRSGFSFGYDSVAGEYRYMNLTPGAPNDTDRSFERFLEDGVSFSVPRGVYETTFNVELTATDPLAEIRYTTDGTAPGWATGELYTTPISIEGTTALRAIALKPGIGLSDVETHTYLIGLTDQEKTLPVLSIVTDERHFTGADGIENPENVWLKGRAWERPVSVEFIRQEDNSGFQINSGIRIHGCWGRNQPRQSYRLYFRAAYGAEELAYPFFPESRVENFKSVVVRRGAQDRNPFILDEFTRSLHGDMGNVRSHGNFVYLFLNGENFGYYNPVERQNVDFFRSWHGGDEDWDVYRQDGLTEGSDVAWNHLFDLVDSHDLSLPENYQQVTQVLDVANYIDYILLNTVAGTYDWPWNNWTAARERSPEGRFRFYVWDAEYAFGRERAPHFDTVRELLAQGDELLPRIYQGLSANAEFRTLFAERFRKHFFEDGALTDAHMMTRFLGLREQMIGAIPGLHVSSAFQWIHHRRHVVEKSLSDAGLLDPIHEPVSAVPPKGEIAQVEIQLPSGTPDLTGDSFVDCNDLVDFLDQRDVIVGASAYGRCSLRNDSWERYEYPVDRGIKSLLAVDLDGDGVPDLAAANPNFDSLLLFRGNGDGTFRTPSTVKVGLGGLALGTADFNQDDTPDLVLGSSMMHEHRVSVLANQGDSTFATVSSVRFNDSEDTKNLHPRSVLPRDIDRDGDLDILVQNESSAREDDYFFADYITVLVNEGDSHFVASDSIRCGSLILTGPHALVAEDLDGDLDTDLVALSGVQLLLLFINQGSGTFAEPVEIDAGFSAFPLVSVVGSDFDGDGDVDLAACNDWGYQFRILVNDGNAGFSLGDEHVVVPGNPHSLADADFDCDGDTDLLLMEYNPFYRAKPAFRILYNDGFGQFDASDQFRVADEMPFPKSFAVADFDSDGDNDFAAADEFNGTLTVFLNQTVPSPPSPDINGDGEIDMLDVLEIGDRWGNVTAP